MIRNPFKLKEPLMFPANQAIGAFKKGIPNTSRIISRFCILMIVSSTILTISCGSDNNSNDSISMVTYRNSQYQYVFDYPRTWGLDTLDAPDIIFVSSPISSGAEAKFIVIAGEMPDQTKDRLDELMNDIANNLLAQNENSQEFEILSNSQNEGKWMKVLTYQSTSQKNQNFQGEIRVTESIDSTYLYFVLWYSESDWVDECHQIIGSFSTN